MDPGGPPRPAPFHAGARAFYPGEPSSSSSPPPPPPPQQGSAIQPVPQASLPADHGADALPLDHESLARWLGDMHLTEPSPPPQQHQQQQGHAIQNLGAGTRPFVPGLPVPGLIPPLRPQFELQQQPYWSSGGYLPTVDAGTAAGNYPYHSLGPDLGPTEWEAQPSLPPHYQASKLVDIRWSLFHFPFALLHLVMSPDPEYSAIMVHRLQDGDKKMRDLVLAGFMLDPHPILGNWQGHDVFKALLDSFYRRHEQLRIIVEAAVMPPTSS
ncbi:hypothetical protein ZWY2020_007330 [Hordeum vulgare]|nr:hypothetical protein ZWY2020_007330 [Hordeum vulgare]